MNAHTTIRPDFLASAPVPPIALLRALPPGPLAKEHQRLKRLAELFAPLDRADMEAGVELLLAQMDALDGDADEDTGGAEDEPLTGEDANANAKPGCAIADPDLCIEHNGGSGLVGDRSYAEWHTLASATRRTGRIDGTQRPTSSLCAQDDDEEDDAPEADGDEEDGVGSEEDFMRHAYDRFGEPGCPVSDPSETTLGAPEGVSGQWGIVEVMGSFADGECEPWHQPPTMDGPMAANDRVPA